MKFIKENSNLKNFAIKVIIFAIAALIVIHFGKVLGFFNNVLSILFPFTIGLVIAYIWNMLLNPFEKILFPNSKNKILNHIRRPLSILLSLLVIIGIVALVLYLVIPQIYESIMIVGQGLPPLANSVKEWFLDITQDLTWTEDLREKVMNIEVDWQNIISRAGSLLQIGIGGFIGSTYIAINSLVGFLFSGFTIIIFTIYLLSSKEKIAGHVNKLSKAYLSDRKISKFNYFMNIIDDTFSSFIKGQLLDALIIGILLFIVLTIFRMPFALTISVVVMVTALIPMLGAFIGGGVGFLMISVVDFNQALLFLVLLVGVQQLEGDLIYPKIVGDSIGLPGIWVFAAVIAGGSIAGPLGMLIAVPLIASVYKILRNDVNRRLRHVDQDAREDIYVLVEDEE